MLWAYLGIIFEFLTETVAWERWEGTIEYTFMAPLRRLPTWPAWAPSRCSTGWSARSCSSPWSRFVLRPEMPDANFFAALVVLLVASVSFIGIGMMTAVLPLISPEKGAQLGFVAQGVLLVVSGVYYPVEVLPGWMEAIAAISPGDLRAGGHPAGDPGRRGAGSLGPRSGRCSS